ncbi:hypothetical protein CEXT_810911 [Caerostris extrusa]|uniref:Uncharacterized protein n=1 Tax=Caerostris extrusa TaxID=172846 RepID=A0AAV4MAM5_CAEEX|nr:hypothetical protein CEXT_810911 [Caerostris extrusa]
MDQSLAKRSSRPGVGFPAPDGIVTTTGVIKREQAERAGGPSAGRARHPRDGHPFLAGERPPPLQHRGGHPAAVGGAQADGGAQDLPDTLVMYGAVYCLLQLLPGVRRPVAAQDRHQEGQRPSSSLNQPLFLLYTASFPINCPGPKTRMGHFNSHPPFFLFLLNIQEYIVQLTRICCISFQLAQL